MGTRADFYVGRGKEAEWLGSIAFDGYPSGQPSSVVSCLSEKDFRERVAAIIAARDSGTRPDQGWPWPWTDSRRTDYAYAFDEGVVWASCFGSRWWRATEPQPEGEDSDGEVEFPDMRARKNVTFGKRSGLIVLGPHGIIEE